ncbi:MAG: hypothetical protein IJ087_05840 [Eggerthellaceae bacterium]|nr:hypothetical protein [Eggerthellaceae bacterium]
MHLLIEDREGELSAFMKKLDERYAMYFRKVTGRVGHVFQGRFWNEAVETDEYFLAALRYIHANPQTAGICPVPDYPWSSYREYMGRQSITTTDRALDLVGGKEAFARFNEQGATQALPFPKSKLQRHLSLDELSRVALTLLGREVLTNIKSLPPRERNPHIITLRSAGFSEREITRVTGIGKATIHRVLTV